MLRLSRGMAYKNAVDRARPRRRQGGHHRRPARPTRREALLRAYGRFVESLGGRYVTACDVGTYVADMDVVGKETRFATGRSEADGGAGDSSVLTAYGVFQGMRASAEHVWGSPDPGRPHGRRRRGRQGRAAAHGAPDRGRRPRRGHRRQRAGGRGGARPRTRRSTSHRTPRRWSRATSTSTPRAPSAAPWTSSTVESLSAAIVCGGGQQPAGRRGRARHRRPAAGAGHHLRARLPGQRRRRDPGQRRAARLQLRAGPQQDRPRSSTTPARCCGWRPSAASPRRSPPTGSPRSGWRPSATRPDLAPGALSRGRLVASPR